MLYVLYNILLYLNLQACTSITIFFTQHAYREIYLHDKNNKLIANFFQRCTQDYYEFFDFEFCKKKELEFERYILIGKSKSEANNFY